jgi:hypothetical protein
MAESKIIKTREELKSYFETGDFPTETQFEELLDNQAHLKEFNFRLDIKPSSNTKKKHYHFYKSLDKKNGFAGHKIQGFTEETEPKILNDYNHVLSRTILYKELNVKIVGAIDIEKHQPKIIIERYKQRKKMQSGYIKSAGFYKESNLDAIKWNRKSEYIVSANEMTLDLEPIHYFKPHQSYNQFLPSGSYNRLGSFKYSNNAKPFALLRMKLQIIVNGVTLTSQPKNFKVVLGTSNLNDAINFVFD